LLRRIAKWIAAGVAAATALLAIAIAGVAMSGQLLDP